MVWITITIFLYMFHIHYLYSNPSISSQHSITITPNLLDCNDILEEIYSAATSSCPVLPKHPCSHQAVLRVCEWGLLLPLQLCPPSSCHCPWVPHRWSLCYKCMYSSLSLPPSFSLVSLSFVPLYVYWSLLTERYDMWMVARGRQSCSNEVCRPW